MSNIATGTKTIKIESDYRNLHFYEGKISLEKAGYPIVISLQDNALLRIQNGVDHDISRNGNWVVEDFNYIPEKGIYLSKVPIICENAKKATNNHRNGKEFYLNDEQVERVLTDSVQISTNQNPIPTPIPTDRFGEDPITIYAFGNIAKAYGDFLKELGIKEMHISLELLEKKPFARKVWFRDLVYDGSGLVGHLMFLGSSRLRGVRYAEGVTQNLEKRL